MPLGPCDDQQGGVESRFPRTVMPNDTPHTPPDQASPSDRVSALIGMDIDEYLNLDQEAHRPPPVDHEARRGFKAMMLAPTIEICQALLAGERVPWWVLNGEQARRFKLRAGLYPLDERVGLDDFNDARS
jgi:hypothetical protein